MISRFEDALARLYGAERHSAKLGLAGTEHLLAALGNPHRRFRAVHVGGTNGKGSVSALIERVLRASSIRTGLFTSPHLVDFRERIRVAGRWAAIEDLERRLDRISALSPGDPPTFFEVTTALAFDVFAAESVEWAVVEVGLGGRLDCTNVLTPDVAAITEIGLDHTEVLGATLEAVAGEKAGIVKRGIPLVTGVSSRAAETVIERRAADCAAPLVRARERVSIRDVRLNSAGASFTAEVSPWGALPLAIALRGRHQVENARVALAALAEFSRVARPLDADAVREGFAAASWPGRLEPCPAEPRLWWDGAHNPDGMTELARAWSEDLGFEPPSAFVIAVSRDKDAARMFSDLATLAPAATAIVTRARNARALHPDEFAAHAAAMGRTIEALPDVASAVRYALERAGNGRVLLAGSLFAVGEAMEAFGGAPGETL